jgi:peptidoglycan/LPS O-acetylase OafA/YrhL
MRGSLGANGHRFTLGRRSPEWAGMPPVVAIVSLIVGAAGWYYLFYSKAANRLAGVEAAATNGRRQRLRRANGAVLVALAGLFYAGFTLDPHRHPLAYGAVWTIVLFLLAVVLALVLIDLRLTARLPRPPKP